MNRTAMALIAALVLAAVGCGSEPAGAPAVVAGSAPAPTAEVVPTPAPAAASPDRDALIALYDATYGWRWTNDDNWLSDLPLSEWHGVSVDDDGRVIGLFLSNNGLVGKTIPPEIGVLSNLRELNLEGNFLVVGIPPEIGALSNLRKLVLSESGLRGEIPPELGGLAYLSTWELSGNQLSGCVPDAWRDREDYGYNDFAELGLPFCEP